MSQKKKISKESFDEIKKLAEEADNFKNLELGFEDEFNEVSLNKIEFTDDVQNPKESYRLYYAIEGILRNHLPKGEEFNDLRKVVREEKSIFLTGKRKDITGRRNADSRQAFISSHLKVALNELFDWIREGGNSFDLFLKFRKLNVEYGYFKEEEASDFDQIKKKSTE